MIRWKYLVPRLIVLLLLAVFFGVVFQPLAHWAVIRFGTTAIGAKVDVSELNLSLAETNVHLKDVQVTDPSAPDRNIFEATDLVLNLDRQALLQRQLVIREGRISGLRFSTLRETSGRLERVEQPKDDGDDFDAKWLQMFSDRLREDIEADLETVRVANELKVRWPAEYRQLEQRADDMETRMRRLRDAVRRTRDGDILRDAGVIQQATIDIDAIRKELESLPVEIRRLRDSVKQDRQSIELAKQHDVDYLKDRFRLERFDAETLSRYFLKGEEATQVRELLAWIEWGRQFVPQKREFDAPQRRGWKIRFQGLPNTPDWLIERLAVDGVATRNGQELPFAGEVRDVTWQQALVGRPTTMDICTGGTTPVKIHAVLDRTRDDPVDHFLVECPALELDQRTLGRPDKLALNIAAAEASVRLELEMRGDQVDGQLVYRQDRLHMEAAVPEGQLSQGLVQRLNQGASQVQQVTATVSLTGPLSRPRLNLQSDLGDQLCTGFNLAFQAELNERGDQLRSKLDHLAEKQLHEIQQRVDDKVQELLARLDGPREELAQLAQALPSVRGLAESLNLPDAVRKASFPWSEPWRR